MFSNVCVCGWVGGEEPALIFHAIVFVENEHFVTLYCRLNESSLFITLFQAPLTCCREASAQHKMLFHCGGGVLLI